MKNIYKVLIGVAVTATLLVALDWAVGTWSEKMYYKSKYGIFHRQIYCLRESKDDILILGSSRAAHHYVPQVFEDSLGMSCYNAGSDGMCIYYHYAILASRIHRGYPPKLVIYDVMGLDATISDLATFTLDAALDRLAPHYGEIPEIDSLFALAGWKQSVKMCSKVYRYNSKLVQTIKCNYIPWPEDRGYEALMGKLTVNASEEGAEDPSHDNDLEFEHQKLVYIQKLINLCKSNNINLIFCYSPFYNHLVGNGAMKIKELALKNGIEYYDYNSVTEFQNPEYYEDAGHLNDFGANAYSKKIVSSIKNYLGIAAVL